MKGLLIVWGLILSATGAVLHWGSGSTYARSFFSSDPILILGTRNDLSPEERITLRSALLTTFGSMDLSSDNSGEVLRRTEARTAFGNLFQASTAQEKEQILLQLQNLYQNTFDHQSWAKQAWVTELLIQNYENSVVESLYKTVLHPYSPALKREGPENTARRLLVELAIKHKVALKETLSAIARTFSEHGREQAHAETLGRPCPVSRSGALLIEILTETEFALDADEKKSIVRDFLAVGADLKFDPLKDDQALLEARTTRLDMLRILNRLNLPPADQLELLAPIIGDPEAAPDLRKIAAELTSVVAQQSNPAKLQERIKKLADLEQE